MKLNLLVLSGAIFFVAPVQAQDQAAADDSAVEVQQVAEPVVKKKKPKKITDRNHPDFRRCRSEPIIGSLARKRRVCMTNREWAEMTRSGNRQSREMVEDMQVGIGNSN